MVITFAESLCHMTHDFVRVPYRNKSNSSLLLSDALVQPSSTCRSVTVSNRSHAVNEGLFVDLSPDSVYLPYSYFYSDFIHHSFLLAKLRITTKLLISNRA